MELKTRIKGASITYIEHVQPSRNRTLDSVRKGKLLFRVDWFVAQSARPPSVPYKRVEDGFPIVRPQNVWVFATHLIEQKKKYEW